MVCNYNMTNSYNYTVYKIELVKSKFERFGLPIIYFVVHIKM